MHERIKASQLAVHAQDGGCQTLANRMMGSTRRKETTMESRRSFISKVAGGAAAMATAAAPGTAATPPRRPNILWICTDQQRWDTIHALGNEHIRTPSLDALAETGVTFTHAYCQSPICTPSRASFLTGMYPSTVHACMNGNEHWDEAAPLITKTLADAGYDCGLSGKLHLSTAQAHEPEIRPKADGYRRFWFSHSPGQGIGKGNQYTDWLESEGHDYKALKEKYGYLPAPLHQSTWCADRAIDFIREERSGSWLFSLNCFDPHPPFDPPQEYVDRFDVASLAGPLFREADLEAQRRLSEINFQTKPTDPKDFDGKLHQAKYWAQIELIDENVGRILRALEETGQRDDTLIIFTSDHGDMVGDHGLRAKGCRFYEGLVRVPLMISWPERFRQGLRSEALVELTDITPTLLELLGLPIPETMHGTSLLPILTGAADPRSHREFVRSEYYGALEGPQSYATMIRTRRHKLVNYHGHGLGELFDMESDPGEFDNLWDDPQHAEVRFELMTRNFDALAFAVDIGPRRIGRY